MDATDAWPIGELVTWDNSFVGRRYGVVVGHDHELQLVLVRPHGGPEDEAAVYPIRLSAWVPPPTGRDEVEAWLAS